MSENSIAVNAASYVYSRNILKLLEEMDLINQSDSDAVLESLAEFYRFREVYLL